MPLVGICFARYLSLADVGVTVTVTPVGTTTTLTTTVAATLASTPVGVAKVARTVETVDNTALGETTVDKMSDEGRLTEQLKTNKSVCQVGDQDSDVDRLVGPVESDREETGSGDLAPRISYVLMPGASEEPTDVKYTFNSDTDLTTRKSVAQRRARIPRGPSSKATMHVTAWDVLRNFLAMPGGPEVFATMILLGKLILDY